VDWCRERLAYFKVPRYIEFVDDFPRTITKQEIARHELRARGIGDCWDSRRDSR
jgi:crotonobetaine/carnitine-CoA ligase